MAKRARSKKSGSRASPRSRAPSPPPSLFSVYWRPIVTVVVLVAFAALLAWAISQTGPDEDGNGNGKELAPTYSLQDIDGHIFSSEVFKGRVVVLDLFATWCGPCAVQMEQLNRLRAHYPENVIVIVSVDVDPRETTQDVRAFKEEHGGTWYFARDTDNLNGKYDASNIPTMAVIDQEGYLVWRHQGTVSFEELRDIIQPLLICVIRTGGF